MHPTQLFAEAVRLHGANRLPEAERFYRQVLAVSPRHADALNMLAFLFHQTGRDRQAIPLYRKAIAITADFAPYHSNLAHALIETSDREDALLHFRQAIRVDPCHPDAGIGLAIVLRELGRYEDSVASLRRVIEFDPDNVLAHTNLGFVLLMQGKFESGWKEMEWRIRNPEVAPAYRASSQPRWPGPSEPTGRLLVYAEQGLGDSIQFCRYVPIAAALGLDVTLQVQSPLVRLCRSLGPNITVVAQGQTLPRFDFQIPMMSLPAAFATSVQTIPDVIPYLQPEAADIERWEAHPAVKQGKGLRVGLVWSGNPQHGVAQLRSVDRQRSLDPSLLQPLLNIPDVTLFSLQKDGRVPRTLPFIDLMPSVADMADTAALIANLDLVISVDTSVAHLAAALGKPTWLLDRFNHDWRWLAGQENSPWYPTMRIYRQNVLGQWKPVIRKLANDLRTFAALSYN
ncbi:MAG: tetratricopeptide repeat protein [Janthinobacterium lividum]